MTLRIEDYAMIGDCKAAALMGRDGSFDWLCWSRFDSGACFAALLGDIVMGCCRTCRTSREGNIAGGHGKFREWMGRGRFSNRGLSSCRWRCLVSRPRRCSRSSCARTNPSGGST
jgi:Domain of unknown function (DUF5911)